MKDYGGYLEFERYQGTEYHDDALALNTARNCLRYLIRARQIKSIWMPKLNCNAVFDTCRQENVKLKFYNIGDDLNPLLPETDGFVYVVNFYGQLEREYLQELRNKYEHLIVDNVQAFFEKPLLHTDTIYTCRKYFGVTDGAYLYTDAFLEEELDQDRSTERIKYLAGRLETDSGSFFDEFHVNENLLENLPLRRMSAFTQNILRSLDYTEIKKKREENFNELNKALKNINLLHVHPVPGPYMYPLLINNGDAIRKKLLPYHIFVPVLWPVVLKDNPVDSLEYRYANNVLPLPCDQRYSSEDMKFIVETIKGELT